MIARILKIAELVEAADNSNVKLVAELDNGDAIEFHEINVYVGTEETVIVLEHEQWTKLEEYNAEENN